MYAAAADVSEMAYCEYIEIETDSEGRMVILK
jgi:hypothetical protein